jgi:hypothetical protein
MCFVLWSWKKMKIDTSGISQRLEIEKKLGRRKSTENGASILLWEVCVLSICGVVPVQPQWLSRYPHPLPLLSQPYLA